MSANEWLVGVAVFLAVFLVILAAYGLAELWFRWSFRRDARALYELHRHRMHHVPPRPLPPYPTSATPVTVSIAKQPTAKAPEVSVTVTGQPTAAEIASLRTMREASAPPISSEDRPIVEDNGPPKGYDPGPWR